jgi:DDE domain
MPHAPLGALRVTGGSLPNTYVKVAGRSTYLYRAVDHRGQVIDLLSSIRRDAAAARSFSARALRSGPVPVEVVTDRAQAYPRVVGEVTPAAQHVTERYVRAPSRQTMAGSKPGYGRCEVSNAWHRRGRSRPGTHSCRTCAAGTTSSPATCPCTIGSASRSTSWLWRCEHQATRPPRRRPACPPRLNAT